jgi:hypothetical protein
MLACAATSDSFRARPKRVAAEIANRGPSVDVHINNAGAIKPEAVYPKAARRGASIIRTIS